MSAYGISIELDTDIHTAREYVIDALAEQGFGILTEIDVADTLKKKIGKDVPPQIILGACNPALADRALEAETSIGLLLPCNVVLRSVDDTHTVVEALDPGVMVTFTGNPTLEPVAAEARLKLTAALATLTKAGATGTGHHSSTHSDGLSLARAPQRAESRGVEGDVHRVGTTVG